MSGAEPLDVTDQLTTIGQVGSDLPIEARIEALTDIAQWVRRVSLHRAHTTGQGHLGSDFSVTDILVTLYCSVMRISPEGRHGGDAADRLILSKGHAVVALYASMVAAGVLEASYLRTSRSDGLPGHPVRGSVPGIGATTGSLGHGLSLGVGTALGARMDGSQARTFVVLGDGELQEGSNWEALMLAAHLRLGSLIAVIDANGLQRSAPVSVTNGIEPLAAKLTSFGWSSDEVDGHDFNALIGALDRPDRVPTDAPRAVIARTTKGQGVSFMMGEPTWHHRIPDEHELARALVELGG